jgi:hypothetical protein
MKEAVEARGWVEIIKREGRKEKGPDVPDLSPFPTLS